MPSTNATLAIVARSAVRPPVDDRGAIDERHGPNRRERNERQAADLQCIPRILTADVPALQGAAQRHIHEDREPDGERGLRTGAENRERHPAEEKPHDPAVRTAQIHVVAARLRHHCRDFRVRETSGQREQSCGDPHQHDHFRAAHVAGHDAGLQKDTGADHIGDIDGNCRPRTNSPGQFGPRYCLSALTMHPSISIAGTLRGVLEKVGARDRRHAATGAKSPKLPLTGSLACESDERADRQQSGADEQRVVAPSFND